MNEVNDQERYLQPFYKRQRLHFECTQCGVCCTGNQDYYVHVSPDEVEKIRHFLGISHAWFKRRYMLRLDEQNWGLRSEHERCVFLTDAGRCRIYPVRPVQCCTYPFWPEVLKTAKAWQREAGRCEGINRGAVVPAARVSAALRRMEDNERG